MKYLLILPLFASCGIIPTTADIREIADELDAYGMGYQTQEQTVAALDAKVNEIGDRKTPMSIQELLIAAAATAVTGGVGVNSYRNRKRVKNSEPV